MVNIQQNALRKREPQRDTHPRPAGGGSPGRPWRQWHAASQAQQSLPLEVAVPSRPQWGRYIYLGIIALIALVVLREVYTGLFWFNAQGAISGRQYNVSPSQTVAIADVLISPSEKVTAGQPLVKLNSPELVQALARNEAEIARIQADLVESSTRMESNREDLRTRIESNRAKLEALESKSKTEIERINAMRRLVAAGAVSKSSLQDLEMEHAETWSEYTRVKSELDSAYRQTSSFADAGGSMQSGAAMPEQRLSSLTELRNSIQDQLNNLELRAPSDGIVAKVPVSKGDVLKAGEPAVILLEQDDTRAFMYFPASAQGKLEVGQTVPSHTSSGAEFPLRIVKIYPRMESKAAQEHSELNAPDGASLVVEAVPANGDEFPSILSSGTPIYGRVPRWSFAKDIEQSVAKIKSFLGTSNETGAVNRDEPATSLSSVN